MKLADVAVGSWVTVEQVGGERSFRRRLMELGLVPGTRVRLSGIAPLGDPLELLVRGATLSIRRNEAKAIQVRPESSSATVVHAASPESRKLERPALGMPDPG